MPQTMKDLLTSHILKKVYLFTTQGHVVCGTLQDVEDLVRLHAPDGQTEVQLNLSDISGVRLYAEEAEALS